MNGWSEIIQNWLYPPICLLCGDPGADGMDLCAPCEHALPRNLNACVRCGLPLAAGGGLECGTCQKRPPPFDSAFAPFLYEEPIGHLTRALKFGSRQASARLLGTLFARAIGQPAALPEAILPVPLHAARYRQRGFNQAAEIARVVGADLNLPLDFDTCRRVRATDAQAQLTARERRRNLRNAFVSVPRQGYRHVAIFDDVVTTGTTVGALAKTLKRAGIARVDVWACARAPL